MLIDILLSHINKCHTCQHDAFLCAKVSAYREETFELHIPERVREISYTVANNHVADYVYA